MKKAFTLIELIFTIVIIGVLASFAIPRFSGLSNNSKISAELSTASSIQSAIDSCHGEWIINEANFNCANGIHYDNDDAKSDFTEDGYPKNNVIKDSNLTKLLKNATSISWEITDNKYKGPASKTGGVSTCKENKPCISKHWDYNETEGTFTLTQD